MKNFFRFLLMSLFLATSFSVASCSDDDDNPADSIVGTWVLAEDEEMSLTIQFNQGGTGSIDYQSEWEDETQRFEYIYEPEERYLEIIGSVLYGEYKVTVSNSVLKLKDIDDSGYSLTFTRK